VIVGERVFFNGEMRTSGGVLADPALVRCLVRFPEGQIGVLAYPSEELTRTGEGLYRASILLTSPGVWYFRWETSGEAEGAEEMQLEVQGSAFV